MNFFKLYVGDYQRDTAHLSVTEHGAYLLMLQHYYATERPLPTGKALHRMLRAQDKAEREAIDSVAEQYWQESADGLINKRADIELGKAAMQAETNRRIAVQREQSRKATRNASRTEHESCTNRSTNTEPNQTPDTRHQEITTPPTPPSAEGGLPVWLPEQEWTDFVAMRKAKGKRAPFTAAAQQGIVRQLDKLRSDGNDPAEVLRQSTMNGWSGVFALRGTGNVRPFASRQAELMAKHFPRIAAKRDDHAAIALG